ncbi:unnamed protein product [Bursaphelenchus okinawaensis]|uniref:Serine/threonine-protein phosphatase n=1 Tax=Bursaphelenchus okinawaensis TaxID=465554 RepID=A0A811LQM9_9BILA|nr:unnamed protein product [Bursaphelenchus okinawaensis]CAG9126694.1 unnamed protein product [Bursaphelenchus okinawaensis]
MSLNLEEFINRFFSYYNKNNFEFTSEEIFEVLKLAKPVFCKNTSALVQVPTPVNIVGDIHGQLDDLLRIFAAIGVPGKERYLFLGDYVDRGPNQLECIMLLLALKVAASSRIYLLRGNHEVQSTNQVYGFRSELNHRFKRKLASRIYSDINNIFTYLPLAAIVKGRILCMHGGLSPHLKSLDDIRRIQIPFEEPPVNSLEEDLLWADPSSAISGFNFNVVREISICFGADVVHSTCTRLGVDLIVRAHQVMPSGYGLFANKRLVTVFSAASYNVEQDNMAAVMRVSKKLVISYVLFAPPLAADVIKHKQRTSKRHDSSDIEDG